MPNQIGCNVHVSHCAEHFAASLPKCCRSFVPVRNSSVWSFAVQFVRYGQPLMPANFADSLKLFQQTLTQSKLKLPSTRQIMKLKISNSMPDVLLGGHFKSGGLLSKSNQTVDATRHKFKRCCRIQTHQVNQRDVAPKFLKSRCSVNEANHES